MARLTYEIDGKDFATLEEFYTIVERTLIPGAEWGHNLDAFNDILRGGFGTPENGFRLRWINSEVSRQRLGYTETVRHLEFRLSRCHPSNRQTVAADLARARIREGSTVFEWLIEILKAHCPGGTESDSNLELVLD